MTVLGFLHTAAQHVATFDGLLERYPGHRAVHLVDEALLDLARTGGAESVEADLERRLGELVEQGADVVICTCSTLGAAAEQVLGGGAVDVVRVDRPMARQAVRAQRIGVVVALESTVAPTVALLEQEAGRLNRSPSIEVVHATQAWSRWVEGDVEGYLEAVAARARSLALRVDVIVLAQASMAPAAKRLGETGTRVLSSPASAVAAVLGP